MYIYIHPSSAHLEGLAAAMSTCGIQSLVSKSHFPLEETRLLGEMTDSRAQREMYKMSLKHLALTKSKCSKNDEDMPLVYGTYTTEL